MEGRLQQLQRREVVLEDAYLYERTIDSATYGRQRDTLRQEIIFARLDGHRVSDENRRRQLSRSTRRLGPQSPANSTRGSVLGELADILDTNQVGPRVDPTDERPELRVRSQRSEERIVQIPGAAH